MTTVKSIPSGHMHSWTYGQVNARVHEKVLVLFQELFNATAIILKLCHFLLDVSQEVPVGPIKSKLSYMASTCCYDLLSQLNWPSSDVLQSSSLLLKVIWRCSTSLLHYMVPLYGFSIIIWFHYMVSQSSYGSIIWFLNHHMVSQNMVSQSSYGSIIWFLNHHMVPLYGFSIIIWFHYMVSQSSYGSIIWFLNHHMVSQNMVSQSKFGKLYVFKSDKCV